MSINSLTNAAAARRADFAPLSRVPNGLGEIAAAAAGMPLSLRTGYSATLADGPTTNSVNTAMQVLFGYIPTEVLTLYVAIVAAIHPSSPGNPTPKVGPEDWFVFWSFLAATPIVLWVVFASKMKSAQKPLPLAFSNWPLWEMFAATVAYVAWTFALPGTPFREFTNWYSAGLAGVVVLVASTVLGLLAPLFQNTLGGAS
jgi:hypothetical protein